METPNITPEQLEQARELLPDWEAFCPCRPDIPQNPIQGLTI